MLLPITACFTEQEASEIRSQLTDELWLDGGLSAGGLAKSVKANQQADDYSPIIAELRQRVLARLSSDPLFISAALPTKIYPPKFNRYRDGGHYGLHVDSAVMTMPDGTHLRSDVSATLFLNDPESYDGGELSIETQYGVKAIKMNAGDLILYPSTSLHQVSAVTRGERVAAFFWIQSMVRTAFNREQLFELDQSIQQLTAERGVDDEEVRRLSTIYHNLLRAWAEV